MRLYALLATTAALAVAVPAAAAVTFVNSLTVAGNAADASGAAAGANTNRLSFGSDLIYDAASNSYYGLADRGPGGGVVAYDTRLHNFTMTVNPGTGAVSNFQVQSTVIFKQANGTPYNGLNPLLLNGSVATLGGSLDPEGLVRRANGNFLVSDEYGPSVIEFAPNGDFIRKFETPANILPQSSGSPDHVNGRNPLTTGRQDNRGFEGLTLSADGNTAYAILQDPLVNEGAQSDGRRSQNLRIVAFDTTTGNLTSGKAIGQYIYQLDSIASLNAQPGVTPTFSATNQGRNIGVSSITALGNGKFLVIERDNRGYGVTNANGVDPAVGTIGSKRVYLIDLNGATDVSATSLAGTSTLPPGVVPVSKSLFLDINAALKAAGIDVAEKIEGLTLGPLLAGGGITLILATDNDFSVTQDNSNIQFDVCTTGFGAGGSSSQVALGAACPQGQFLIPTYVYSFAVTGDDAFAIGVPEPATWALLIAGFGIVGTAMRRRRYVVA